MKTSVYIRFLAVSLLIVRLSGLPLSVQAQSSNQNYVSTQTYILPLGADYIEDISYLDGFGREKQNVRRGAVPGGAGNLITPIHYGAFGRTERNYLSYVRTGNNAAYDPNGFSASNWSVYGTVDQPYAFSRTDYDNSPLNRIVKEYSPGKAWNGSNKGITTTYGFNAVNQVVKWILNSNGIPAKNGYYAVNVLSCTKTTDEDGCSVEVYTDRPDHILLSVQLNGSERLETYYLYDDFDRLRYVLPPEASAASALTEAVLNQYAFSYRYDRWGRQIEKKLPGCTAQHFVYDRKDRLVLSQDGNQALGSKWGYCLYDSKNRQIESGEVILTGKTHTQLQNEAGSSDNYTPAGTCVAYQYTVYDNYITTSGVIAHPFVVRSDYATGYHPLITGMVTSVRNRVVGTDTLLTTTNYYDDRCRLVYSVSDNLFGRKSHLYKKYDFVGNVLKQCEIHEISATRTDVFEVTNVYDNRSRILSSSARLNNGTPATISYSYDAFGRLVKKTYGTLVENLSYNIRGWLTGKSSVPFAMKLRYDQVEGGSTARLNGNISEWEWQQGSSAALMYGFSYDGVNRLTGSVQKQKSGSWQALSADYVEKEISYDRNGNLKTLQRTAGGSIVDHLAYSYTGNRLTGLSEKVRSALSGDIFAPGSSESGSYTYDNNGNMLTDSRRGLIIGYNFLNLVNQVKSGTTVKATYRWLSDGTKLRVFSPDGNGYYYLGSLTYKTDASGTLLETASFGEGVIRPKSSGQELNYFLTDHLGSVRVIADGNGTVLERNDYYPFGAVQAKGYPQNNNRLKYNGKEKQTTGDLNYLDYGSRMYDAGVGRWFAADPACEAAVDQSPYRYGLNNPINFLDYAGLWEITSEGWHTNDQSDITRFLDMIQIEGNTYGSVSDAQMDKFVSEEYHGTGGKLSNGSVLLSGVDAHIINNKWMIAGWQLKQMFAEIDHFGSMWMNWDNMVSSRSFYSYKYYREKQWELNGGSFPGITIGSFAAGYAADFLFNGKEWFDFARLRSYSVNYNGNQYRSFASVSQGKNLAKGLSRGLNVMGKGLGFIGAYGTFQEYRDGKLTNYGGGYLGISDAFGIGGGYIGSGWSFGTGMGKWIVESSWYFNFIHNDRIW